MLRATIHEAAGPTTGFWYNATDSALVFFSSTRLVFEASIAGGRFTGETVTHVFIGSFSVPPGTGTITQERDIVGGEVHFSVQYESRVTFQNYLEDATAAAQSGIVFHGNSFANTDMWGASGDDQLFGGGGDDRLFAYAGNDLLNGGTGADHMQGGIGNDLYYFDNPGDRVLEAAARGTDTVASTVSHALAANVENLTLAGAAAINGAGNTVANVLRGNTANNVLNGGLGADTMLGGLGNDTLIGGLGADAMLGGLGNDTYAVDNPGDRVLEAAARGTDLVRSGVSHTLGANVERLTLTGSAATNAVGNGLNNVLLGNAGNNALVGFAGNDVLGGSAGNDRLNGGLGIDRLAGGADTDVFVFAGAATSGRGAARDVIQDLISGTDRLDLRGIDADSLLAGNQTFEFLGAGAFSGAAGELHLQSGVLGGDLNGDRIADFEIGLTGVTFLAATDILL